MSAGNRVGNSYVCAPPPAFLSTFSKDETPKHEKPFFAFTRPAVVPVGYCPAHSPRHDDLEAMKKAGMGGNLSECRSLTFRAAPSCL